MTHYRNMVFSAAAVIPLVMLLPLSAAAASAPVIGMPGCDTSCGNISVPYPFGLGPSNCYMPGFNLTCDCSSHPPRLLLGDGTLEVSGFINPSYPSLIVVYTGYIKTDGGGRGRLTGGLSDDGPYALSLTDNQLILAGCNVRATLRNGNITMSTCSSFCKNGDAPDIPSGLEGSILCSGMGCCQSPIVVNRQILAESNDTVPITSYDVVIELFGWNGSEARQWPPRVFVARYGWFTEQLSRNNQAADESVEVSLLLNWEIFEGRREVMPSLTASESHQCSRDAASRICKNNTDCTIGARGGYTCSCKQGYEGNPYITDGCRDINGCENSYPCFGQCTNTDGSFQCRCPQGTTGDPNKPGGCFSSSTGDCTESCGNMSVPFPFGIGPPTCYLLGFNLTCDTSHDTPRLMLGNFRVVDIFLDNNTVRIINTDGILDLYPGISMKTLYFYFTGTGVRGPYSLSTSNEVILIGCGVHTRLLGANGNQAILSGCSSVCSSNEMGSYNDTVATVNRNSDEDDHDDDRYCYGIGCCQAHISMSKDGMPSEFWVDWIDPNSVYDDASPRAYTFISEEGWFHRRRVTAQIQNRRSKAPDDPTVELEVPIILEWEVLQLQPAAASWSPANLSSEQYVKCPGICSKNSHCKPRNRGYTCHCNQGYDGNPYIMNGCAGGSNSFKGMNVIIGVASGLGIVLLILGALFILKKLKHRRARKMKRMFFEQNRGQLLQQLVSQKADITEKMIISLEELEKATNNFDKARELGGGGHGTVYKGILSDLHVVAIKKPKRVVHKEKEIREFINEVAILSQINHRNVVRLYGCCLETEVPMLVYEFISNGTLYDHLHVEGLSLSWDDRLRIAIEAAKSLAYLHSAASIPIIHRDVKSSNILLDDTLTAKVADFGASRCIPMDISGVTTRAQGTRGYWDPMNFYTGRITEKSDVYSFGVFLVELLTREKPFSYLSSDDESLVAHFAALFEKGQLLQILDPQVIEEGGKEVGEVAIIAISCVKLRREDRPTMRQVELTLEGTRASPGHTAVKVHPSTQFESNPKGSTRRCSMELEFRLSGEYPR